ncbi:hypothetical protein FA15DRAFT_671664 [Coprinopsis marcescibilis]|uniref:Uncharacterized protein n=1 Tax=Coprinopsis marcescibilis TaxID=230819 RepID=A0A5C3KPI2_COPMA|nr:hypothetical protein FA15DRAFT_671664 [Coprinopsis marcescibilis]
MPFFTGAHNFNINSSTFNDVSGNYYGSSNNHERRVIGSHNTNTTSYNNSFNNNSKRHDYTCEYGLSYSLVPSDESDVIDDQPHFNYGTSNYVASAGNVVMGANYGQMHQGHGPPHPPNHPPNHPGGAYYDQYRPDLGSPPPANAEPAPPGSGYPPRPGYGHGPMSEPAPFRSNNPYRRFTSDEGPRNEANSYAQGVRGSPQAQRRAEPEQPEFPCSGPSPTAHPAGRQDPESLLSPLNNMHLKDLSSPQMGGKKNVGGGGEQTFAASFGTFGSVPEGGQAQFGAWGATSMGTTRQRRLSVSSDSEDEGAPRHHSSRGY